MQYDLLIIAKNDICLFVQHLHNGNSYLVLGFCNSLIHFLSAVVYSLLPPFFAGAFNFHTSQYSILHQPYGILAD